MRTERQIKQIFAAALEKKPGAEREAYLTAACQGEPDLRQQVESLLQGQDKRALLAVCDFICSRLPPRSPEEAKPAYVPITHTDNGHVAGILSSRGVRFRRWP